MPNLEKRASDPEIDYRYPDEQGGPEENFYEQEGTSSAQNKPAGGRLKPETKKKLIVWGIVGALLFVVYQALTPSPDEVVEGVPQKMEPVGEKSQATTEKKVVTEVKKTASVGQKKAPIELSPARDSVSGNGQTAPLQMQLQGMSKEITELKEALSALIGTMEVMATQVQELRQAQQVSPSTFIPFRPNVPYFLKAVIVGRAWLESADGNLITVKQGDVIPEYGTVNKIDHNEGWVETSSGLIITYGKNDS